MLCGPDVLRNLDLTRLGVHLLIAQSRCGPNTALVLYVGNMPFAVGIWNRRGGYALASLPFVSPTSSAIKI